MDLVYQGREDKGVALKQACAQLQLDPEDCLYMGDDWPDLSALHTLTRRLFVYFNMFSRSLHTNIGLFKYSFIY